MPDIVNLAKSIRRDALLMVHKAQASHIASALSIADIVAVLYGSIMQYEVKDINSPSRDRFILSKGHACVAVYGALAEVGILKKDDLETYGLNFSPLMNHISHKIKGVEFSTGALGHGLPFGVGKALSGRITQASWRTFVLLSDGEMDEGSNWEALMFAAHHELNNLTAIIDYNKLQSLGSVDSTISLEPLADKLRAFGWHVREVDGHCHEELSAALSYRSIKKPNVIIAHTVKGKGVDFMEHKVEWHYKSPTENQLADALAQLESDV